MALDFNIEPPRWLEDQSKWAKGISERGVNQFWQGAQAAQQLKTGLLDMHLKEQQMQLNDLRIADQAGTATERVQWLQEVQANGGGPMAILNTPYTGKGATGRQWALDMQDQASKTTVVNKVKQDAIGFREAVNRLPPELAADTLKLAQMYDKFGNPTPEAFEALSKAQLKVPGIEQRRETDKMAREINLAYIKAGIAADKKGASGEGKMPEQDKLQFQRNTELIKGMQTLRGKLMEQFNTAFDDTSKKGIQSQMKELDIKIEKLSSIIGQTQQDPESKLSEKLSIANPDWSAEKVQQEVEKAKGKQAFANNLAQLLAKERPDWPEEKVRDYVKQATEASFAAAPAVTGPATPLKSTSLKRTDVMDSGQPLPSSGSTVNSVAMPIQSKSTVKETKVQKIDRLKKIINDQSTSIVDKIQAEDDLDAAVHSFDY